VNSGGAANLVLPAGGNTRQAKASGDPTSVRAETAPVESEVLFQGQRTVQISHNGEIYRLQATRLGKLILTK